MNQDISQLLATIDILNIPSHAGSIVGAFWLLSIACAIPLFVLSCMYEYTKFIKNDPKDAADFYGTALRMLIFVISFLAYNAIMKIPYFFDFIGMTLLSWDDWSKFVKLLTQNLNTANEVSLINFHFSSLLMYVSLFLAAISEVLFMGLRFILLFVGYSIGPILLLLGIYRPLRHLSNGWLTYFFQISFWPVTLKLVQSAVLAFQYNSFLQGGNPFVITIVSFIMVLMYFIGVPSITATLLSQKNMGSMAEGIASGVKSLAAGGVGAATGAVTGFISGAAAEAGIAGAEKAAGAAGAAAQPSISSGDTPGNTVKDDKSAAGDSADPSIKS